MGITFIRIEEENKVDLIEEVRALIDEKSESVQSADTISYFYKVVYESDFDDLTNKIVELIISKSKQ